MTLGQFFAAVEGFNELRERENKEFWRMAGFIASHVINISQRTIKKDVTPSDLLPFLRKETNAEPVAREEMGEEAKEKIRAFWNKTANG